MQPNLLKHLHESIVRQIFNDSNWDQEEFQGCLKTFYHKKFWFRHHHAPSPACLWLVARWRAWTATIASPATRWWRCCGSIATASWPCWRPSSTTRCSTGGSWTVRASAFRIRTSASQTFFFHPLQDVRQMSISSVFERENWAKHGQKMCTHQKGLWLIFQRRKESDSLIRDSLPAWHLSAAAQRRSCAVKEARRVLLQFRGAGVTSASPSGGRLSPAFPRQQS